MKFSTLSALALASAAACASLGAQAAPAKHKIHHARLHDHARLHERHFVSRYANEGDNRYAGHRYAVPFYSGEGEVYPPYYADQGFNAAGNFDGFIDSGPRPFRTVQPTNAGQGVLAPNGYSGPGTASGGPAGGLDNGGR